MASPPEPANSFTIITFGPYIAAPGLEAAAPSRVVMTLIGGRRR